jgi:hydrogenase maturation protease
MAQKTLVLGLGNILLQDEGLGVAALQRLMAWRLLPESAEAMDGGVMGLDLLPHLDGVTNLLILDAVQTGQAPGALVRLEGETIPATLAHKLSMHQIGLQELLAVSRFRGTMPERVVLWGIEPASMKPGVGLSHCVAAQIDSLVQAAVCELHHWEGDRV